MEYFYTDRNLFTAFSLEHLLVVLGFICVVILTFSLARKNLTKISQFQLGLFISLIPVFFVLLRMYVEYQMNEFTYLEDLPLFICRLASFLLPIMILLRSKLLFGVLYFWIMAGTTNAIITPDIEFGLPHFESVFYWLIHCGLIFSILYSVFVMNWKPRKKDVWRAFWWGNLYLVSIHAFNYFIGANYSYTMYKPIGGSILDYFGPWPLYLITGQLLALGLFWLFYLPFKRLKSG